MHSEITVAEKLIEKLKTFDSVAYGVCDTAYSSYANKYSHAVVLITPHIKTMTLKNYDEEEVEAMLLATKASANKTISELTGFCEAHNIEYLIPPEAQSNEETLVAPFSFKFAAVNAGLGWIGKNGVLVTNEYGPRVRINAILVNCDLPIGKPMTKSMCEQDCLLCINACPIRALKGNRWDIDTLREDLIDYHLCNTHRRRYLQELGRKDSCGLCIAACPKGLL